MKCFFYNICRCLGGETRQAQFVKDVEMAEVMTDMSQQVMEILQNFALDGVCSEPEPEEPIRRKKKGRKRKK